MCAGAVHTPHVLQLSGVGAAASLADHGIAAVADLPGETHPANVTSTAYAAHARIACGTAAGARQRPRSTCGCHSMPTARCTPPLAAVVKSLQGQPA